MPFTFFASGVLMIDVSDDCVTTVVRDTRSPKSWSRFVEKCNMKLFEIQASIILIGIELLFCGNISTKTL